MVLPQIESVRPNAKHCAVVMVTVSLRVAGCGSNGSADSAPADAAPNSYVNPVDCAYGAPEPSAADQAVDDRQSIASTFDFIRQTGAIFDQQQKAADLVSELEGRIASVRNRAAGKARKKELAEQLFTQYPQRQASKTKTYAVISDGAFIGPTNVYAVERIADAAHPQ